MFDSILTLYGVTWQTMLICTAVSLSMGLVIALTFLFRNRATRSFVITLIILPTAIQVVVMMINGNLGAGVAVAGAFQLVRFRGVSGSAREISSIFLTMMLGLATGTGYVGVAILSVLLLSAVQMILTVCPLPKNAAERELKITINEDVDYTQEFEDLFLEFTNKCELVQTKTLNMGYLYELRYYIQLKDPEREKELLDSIRSRNGNLSVSCGIIPMAAESL